MGAPEEGVVGTGLAELVEGGRADDLTVGEDFDSSSTTLVVSARRPSFRSDISFATSMLTPWKNLIVQCWPKTSLLTFSVII